VNQDRPNAAVAAVAQLHDALERANPEVGMGPSLSEMIDRAVKTMGLERHEYDFDEVIYLLRKPRL